MGFYDIAAIAHRLATQDNACTAHPVFVVQQRRRLYGFDLQWGDDNVAWLYDGEEWPEDDPERLEAEAFYDERWEEPEGWTRTGYQDIWEHVTACFTRAAAERYILENKHRLTDPRIYVESAYRNKEWQAVVGFLLEQAK